MFHCKTERHSSAETAAMKVFEFFDNLDDTLLSLTQAPVRSGPEDLAPFLDGADDELHPSVKAARLRWKVHVTEAGVEERFQFRSPMPSGNARNDHVTGRRWRLPEARLSGTALVMLHAGFAPNYRLERIYSRSALERGAHVFVMPLPFHMRRQPNASIYSGQYLFSGDVPRLIRGFLQAAADIRALVLALRHPLSYPRVLVSGLGFGALAAALALSRVEADGLFCVAPVADPFVTLWQTPFGEALRRAARARGFEDDRVQAAMRCVTPIHQPPPRVEVEHIFVAYGTQDRFSPPETVAALLAHCGGARSEELPGGHARIALTLPRLHPMLGEWVGEMGGAAEPE